VKKAIAVTDKKPQLFKKFADLGYKDQLIPVLKGEKGCFEEGWPDMSVTDRDIERWDMQENNVGLRTKYYPTFDIDCYDGRLSFDLRNIIQRAVGSITRPIERTRDTTGRIALVYKIHPLAAPFKKMLLRAQKGSVGFEIEVLGDGQQMVLAGTHPSGERYNINNHPLDLWTADKLPTLDQDKAVKALEDCGKFLEGKGFQVEIKTGNQNSYSASMGNLSVAQASDEEWEEIKQAMVRVPNEDVDWDEWLKVGFALRACAGDIPERIVEAQDMFSAWSAKSDKFDENFTDHKWNNDIDKNFTGNVSAGTIFYRAEQNGWERVKRSAKDVFSCLDVSTSTDAEWEKIIGLGGSGEAESSKTRKSISSEIFFPKDLVGITAPARKWIIDQWIPAGAVTSLYSKGGLGKSLLVQQMMTARALGVDLLTMKTEAGKSLYFSCEEPRDELHRRQNAINSHYMTDMASLSDKLVYWDRQRATSNRLIDFPRDGGAPRLTGLWELLRDRIKEHNVSLVVLDTLADVYSGDENSRIEVNEFVKGCLGQLIAETGGETSILMLGHPSKAEHVDGYSGSTAWAGAVRQMLYMRSPTEDECVGGANSGLRVLSKTKANRAGLDDKLFLEWLPHGYFGLRARQGSGAGTAANVGGGFKSLDAVLEQMVEDGFVLAIDQDVVLRGSSRSGEFWAGRWILNNLPVPQGVPENMITETGLDVATKKLIAAGKLVKKTIRDSQGKQVKNALQLA
jgi:hypothetical protein